LGEIDFVGAVKGSGEDTAKLDMTAPATFSRDAKAEIGERVNLCGQINPHGAQKYSSVNIDLY
jgi:hypothetical protein